MDCKECHELLSPYELGELDAACAERVRAHTAGCAECATLLSALGEVSALTDGLTDAAPPRTLGLRILAAVDQLASPDMEEAPEIMTLEQLAGYLGLPPEGSKDRPEEPGSGSASLFAE